MVLVTWTEAPRGSVVSVVVGIGSYPPGWWFGEHACLGGSSQRFRRSHALRSFCRIAGDVLELSHTALRTGESCGFPFTDKDTEAHWGQVSV